MGLKLKSVLQIAHEGAISINLQAHPSRRGCMQLRPTMTTAALNQFGRVRFPPHRTSFGTPWFQTAVHVTEKQKPEQIVHQQKQKKKGKDEEEEQQKQKEREQKWKQTEMEENQKQKEREEQRKQKLKDEIKCHMLQRIEFKCEVLRRLADTLKNEQCTSRRGAKTQFPKSNASYPRKSVFSRTRKSNNWTSSCKSKASGTKVSSHYDNAIKHACLSKNVGLGRTPGFMTGPIEKVSSMGEQLDDALNRMKQGGSERGKYTYYHGLNRKGNASERKSWGFVKKHDWSKKRYYGSNAWYQSKHEAWNGYSKNDKNIVDGKNQKQPKYLFGVHRNTVGLAYLFNC